MKRNKIELISGLLVLLDVVFYYWILGSNLSGKKILLSILIILNIVGFIINIKYFNLYRKNTYVAFMGYLAMLGFIAITTMLEFLELIK